MYVYTGKQGKGKTYSLVEYLIDNNKDIKVFSNISNIQNVDDITYFTGFKELIELKHKLDREEIKTDKQLVFVYDEIFSELQKHSKINLEVMDFLCQMRKRKIIFLTTAQEWAEIPLTFRRFCRYQIDCNMINIFITGILIKHFNDAENMKWDEELQEHIAPLIDTTITHCRVNIANSYDTFLRISSSPARPSASAADDKPITEEKSENFDKILKSFFENK
ncbi:MAG: hypothetical protein K2G03_01475 [Bacilli bacterium]|nr:hypothetical protein [Bacilli bacterium]